VKIEGLEHRIGRILVPTLKEKKMRAGVLRVVERKLYPGYVFVEMACEDDGSIAENVWFLVKETTGVGDFIGSDGKPTSMPDQDVVGMLAASQKAEEQPGLRPGEDLRWGLRELRGRSRVGGRKAGHGERHRDHLRPLDTSGSWILAVGEGRVGIWHRFLNLCASVKSGCHGIRKQE
jgi:hypothetical protein